MNRHHEYAQGLYEKALDDFHALESLINNQKIRDWLYGFHAQQAVEKAIKAVLAAKNLTFPFTHDIEKLLGLLTNNKLEHPPHVSILIRLTSFGATLRYDFFNAEELPASREILLKIVAEILQWASNNI